MSTRILFVDDDAFLLSAMRRLVWSYDDWECEFAESGAAALLLLEDQEFDVIISDMRMPGMDGAELLSKVRELSPKTIRIILSGQSDCEYSFRAVSPAQQHLDKPCNAKAIKRVVERTVGLRDFLAMSLEEDESNHVSRFKELPALARRVSEMLYSSPTSEETIHNAVGEDQKLEQFVIAFSSFAVDDNETITDIRSCMSVLGIDVMRPIVFASSLFTEFADLESEATQHIMKSSIQTALRARELAMIESGSTEVCDQAMLAGLLHNLAEILRPHSTPLPDRKKDSALAATVLQHWGLSTPVVEAVAFQECPNAAADKEFSPLVALHSANKTTLNEQVTTAIRDSDPRW